MLMSFVAHVFKVVVIGSNYSKENMCVFFLVFILGETIDTHNIAKGLFKI